MRMRTWSSGRSATLAVALAVLASLGASASRAASVSAPAEVEAGASFEVTWDGPGGDTDFVSVDPAGAPDRQYGPYKYAKSGRTLTFEAPGTPGSYVVRYHSGDSGYPVLASAAIEVVAASAELRVLGSVELGGPVVVEWTGPGNPTDFISIDPVGAPDAKYGTYAYASKGSPLTLTAPAEAGEWAVRYHLGASGYAVIGTAPLAVGEVAATVEIPPRATAGSTVDVRWSGPDHERDFISVDPVGAPDHEYGRYAYTAKGSPLELALPDAPGTYAVRYHLGASGYRVIGAATIEATAVSATLAPVSPIVAGQPFEVAWTGPDNELDFVTIVPPGTPEREYGPYAYTRRGNPVRLLAPREAGPYEVRYATGQDSRTLARASVEVRPGAVYGSLRVLGGDAAGSGGAVGAVEVILDASGSMLQKLDGTRRIELARRALEALVGETLPAGMPFALRVFGHREAGSCRTDLELPLAPLDRAAATAKIRAVDAMNLAKTPIADSLRSVANDLADATGQRIVVLVTDGEETCDGDPAAAIGALRASGIDVRVSVVGFAIDELMLEEQFEEWARLGQGRYFDAADGAALQRAIRDAVRPTFEVLAGATVIASGTVGGDPIELAAGQYTVRAGGEPLGAVTIVGGEEATLRRP